jgi:hypothetical protein
MNNSIAFKEWRQLITTINRPNYPSEGNYPQVKNHWYKGKGKIFHGAQVSSTPYRRMERWGLLYAFLTSALGGGKWTSSRPAQITPEEGTPVSTG